MATTAQRADIRAQRRFAAMIDARDFHGRPAVLYTEAERLLDAVGAPRQRYVDVPSQFGDERDEPAGDNPWDSGYGHGSGGNL